MINILVLLQFTVGAFVVVSQGKDHFEFAELLPNNTAAYFSVPDATRLKSQWGESDFSNLLRSKIVKTEVDGVSNRLVPRLKSITERFGLFIDEVAEIPHKQVGIAWVPNPDGALTTCIFVDAGENSPAVEILIGNIAAANGQPRPAESKTMVGSVCLEERRFSDGTFFAYFVDRGCILICGEITLAKEMARNWSTKNQHTLYEAPEFIRCRPPSAQVVKFFLRPSVLLKAVPERPRGLISLRGYIPKLLDHLGVIHGGLEMVSNSGADLIVTIDIDVNGTPSIVSKQGGRKALDDINQIFGLSSQSYHELSFRFDRVLDLIWNPGSNASKDLESINPLAAFFRDRLFAATSPDGQVTVVVPLQDPEGSGDQVIQIVRGAIEQFGLRVEKRNSREKTYFGAIRPETSKTACAFGIDRENLVFTSTEQFWQTGTNDELGTLDESLELVLIRAYLHKHIQADRKRLLTQFFNFSTLAEEKAEIEMRTEPSPLIKVLGLHDPAGIWRDLSERIGPGAAVLYQTDTGYRYQFLTLKRSND